MERRAFIALVGGSILVLPLVIEAQQVGKGFRIGILGNLSLKDSEGSRLWGGLIEELGTLGYVEGQNLTIEGRFSEGRYERLPELAADLVRLKVDAIVVPADQPPALSPVSRGQEVM